MSTGGGEKGSGGGGSVKTPADFLKSIRGRPVVVKLNSGVDYRGRSSPLLFFPSLSLRSLLFLPSTGFPLCAGNFSFHVRSLRFSRCLFVLEARSFMNLLACALILPKNL